MRVKYSGIKPGELSLAEAASLTGLAHSTLTTQARHGRLKATKLGITWIITRDHLNEYLKSVGREEVRGDGTTT